jgi:hypothetical protein
MVMRKGDPTYVVTPIRALFGDGGTEVRIAPLLDGIRGSGEKIWANELPGMLNQATCSTWLGAIRQEPGNLR